MAINTEKSGGGVGYEYFISYILVNKANQRIGSGITSEFAMGELEEYFSICNKVLYSMEKIYQE